MKSTAPIGIFDSGLGGLAVLREVRRILPHEDVLFVGDTQRQPYGPRTVEEVRQITIEISGYLIDKGAKIVLIACNTASAAGGDKAQELFPETPILGMIRPGVTAALRVSSKKRIGIWGTEMTIAGGAYNQMLIKTDPMVQAVGVACPTLLRLAEKGKIENKPYLLDLATKDFESIAEFQADTLILGCTDFTCVRPIIDEVVGNRVSVVDPAEEVVIEARKILEQKDALNVSQNDGICQFFITGDDLDNFSTFGARFLSVPKIDVTRILLSDG
jgi:glutamate racemase